MEFHNRIRNSCFSFSHQPGRVAEIPVVRLPVVQGTSHRWFSHIQPYPVAGDSKDVTVSRVSAASLIIFYSHMMSYDPKKNIESPGFRNWDPFFQTATAVRILEVSTRKGVLSTTGHSTNFARDLVDLVDLLYVYHIYCMYSINITKILYMECYYTNDVYHHIPYIYICIYIYIYYIVVFFLCRPLFQNPGSQVMPIKLRSSHPDSWLCDASEVPQYGEKYMG